jgi:3-hydroxybutyryl-CoA dehydratase
MSFTNLHLFFDDVAVNQEWVSPGRTVTETDVVNFAGVSGDFNPIHMDHEFARTTPFRRPIAHGLLVLSVSSGLSVQAPMMRTLAFISIREWKFVGPVFIGDTLRVRSTVLEIEPRARGRRAVLTWRREVINQEGRVVQEGVTQTLVEGRAGVRAGGEPEGAPAPPSSQEGEGLA